MPLYHDPPLVDADEDANLLEKDDWNRAHAGNISLDSEVNGTLPIIHGGTNATTALGARTNLGIAVGADVQAHDATLDALAAITTTGIVCLTGSDTFAERTITGTASQITVSNGAGIAGDPVIGMCQSVSTGNITLAHNVTAANASIGNLTVNGTLTLPQNLTTGNITLTNNLSAANGSFSRGLTSKNGTFSNNATANNITVSNNGSINNLTIPSATANRIALFNTTKHLVPSNISQATLDQISGLSNNLTLLRKMDGGFFFRYRYASDTANVIPYATVTTIVEGDDDAISEVQTYQLFNTGGGVYDLTIGSLGTSTSLAYDALEGDIQAAIDAMTSGFIVVSGDSPGLVTLTWVSFDSQPPIEVGIVDLTPATSPGGQLKVVSANLTYQEDCLDSLTTNIESSAYIRISSLDRSNITLIATTTPPSTDNLDGTFTLQLANVVAVGSFTEGENVSLGFNFNNTAGVTLGNHNTSIANINTSISNHNTSIANLNTTTGNHNTSITNINGSIASINQSLGNISLPANGSMTNLGINSTLTLNGTVASGNGTIALAGNVTVANNETVGGNLTVGRNATFSGNVSIAGTYVSMAVGNYGGSGDGVRLSLTNPPYSYGLYILGDQPNGNPALYYKGHIVMAATRSMGGASSGSIQFWDYAGRNTAFIDVRTLTTAQGGYMNFYTYDAAATAHAVTISDYGGLHVNGVVAAQFSVTSGAASRTIMAIKPAASQTANQTEWQNSVGTPQSYTSASGQNVTAYTFNPTANQTIVAGSTSGNATFSMPEGGSSSKQVKIYCNDLLGTAFYAFPVGFTNTPQILSQNLASLATVTTANVTITGTTSTGFILLDGY